ncbi:MAG: hypothetical protein JNL08_08320 [Planctomycetes bacterium]|nr:hypothetical protein [Planctomycetota bacterium]
MNLPRSFQGSLIALAATGVASAQTIVPTVVVNSDIAVSQTWGPPNIYELDGEIHVLDGATLTILPGTVIASDTTVNFPTPGSGPASLSIDRGALLIANGTRTQPIVFTSKADGTTPVGGLSTNMTGSYRQTAGAEWGGLTLHGEGYMNTQRIVTNTSVPSSANYGSMEGLLRANLRDYGGGQVVTAFPGGFTSDGQGDNDSSGSLSYVSLRYSGFIAGSTVELNGYSLGAIGRGTSIHHIETINSVDDGIEIWGGTVSLKNVVVWSCGDDSFDVDQGWRGKAQHGLMVQGFNAAGTSQGSGIGDNMFETDGAEFCHWQPVTSSIIANFTVVGAPQGLVPTSSNGGDHATAWRDNARVQYHNCIFMDIGDLIVSNEGSDGEAGNSESLCTTNGVIDWPTRWLTSSATLSAVNPFPGGAELTPAQAYTAQAPGNLIEFRDILFFNNPRPLAYAEADARGVRAPYAGNNNNNVTTVTLPIAARTRGTAVTLTITGGTIVMAPVTFLDPRPVTSDAQTSVEWAPESYGILDGSRYRGGFGEGNLWTTGWAGVAAYGLVPSDTANVDLGGCRPGSQGCPQQVVTGTWAGGTNVTMTVKNLEPLLSTCFLVVGGFQINFPIFGGTLVPSPDIILTLSGVSGSGEASITFTNPPGFGGTTLYSQAAGLDFVQFGAQWLEQFSFSNAQAHLQP